MEVDGGGRRNIVDNTYIMDNWLHFTEQTIRESIYISQLRHHNEDTDLYKLTCINAGLFS